MDTTLLVALSYVEMLYVALSCWSCASTRAHKDRGHYGTFQTKEQRSNPRRRTVNDRLIDDSLLTHVFYNNNNNNKQHTGTTTQAGRAACSTYAS